jgi:hypothetical protein
MLKPIDSFQTTAKKSRHVALQQSQEQPQSLTDPASGLNCASFGQRKTRQDAPRA